MVHSLLDQTISTLGSFIIFHRSNIPAIPVARVTQCSLLSLDLLLTILSNFLRNNFHFNLTLLEIMLTLPFKDPRPLLERLCLPTVVLHHPMLDCLPNLSRSLKASNMKASSSPSPSPSYSHMPLLLKMTLPLIGYPQRIIVDHWVAVLHQVSHINPIQIWVDYRILYLRKFHLMVSTKRMLEMVFLKQCKEGLEERVLLTGHLKGNLHHICRCLICNLSDPGPIKVLPHLHKSRPVKVTRYIREVLNGKRITNDRLGFMMPRRHICRANQTLTSFERILQCKRNQRINNNPENGSLDGIQYLRSKLVLMLNSKKVQQVDGQEDLHMISGSQGRAQGLHKMDMLFSITEMLPGLGWKLQCRRQC